eukprot:COSAG06_NODE_5_length_38423_cov_121.612645_40_plen_111_part_00
MTNNARHALVWLLTVHSATRTSSRTHHRNPGLDIRAIFEEGRENAKFSWHVMARARVFQPRSGKGHKVWRQRNRGHVLGARQLGGFTSFLALGFTSFLAPAISRETNECV